MEYIEPFRDPKYVDGLIRAIHKEINPNRLYRLMEFCGGHTHAIFRHALVDLLPPQIEFIHGPGCPVCVLPMERIDLAIQLARMPDVILCTYADLLRVPGRSMKSLLDIKAEGADVRAVYSVDEALQLAKAHPNKTIIFFAIGFETTTPPTAMAILKARTLGLQNFCVVCNHVLTPVAMHHLLARGEVSIDGLIGPSHVSIVIGGAAYNDIATRYKLPIVISGFEPHDILFSIAMLIRAIHQDQYEVQNQYTRAVQQEPVAKIKAVLDEVFELRSQFAWRGLGEIAYSALKIKSCFRDYDAEYRYDIQLAKAHENEACICGEILRGVKKPLDCTLFAKGCTPHQPLGACMVSTEGACAAFYQYRGSSA